MREINDVQGPLEWVQPRALKMHYELRSNEELVANLSFRSLSGSFATAESADGCWTFKRVGFFQTRATIRACGSDADTATFKNNTWSGGGTLTLADGREFLVTTNVWQTQLEIQTASGEVLVHLKTSGFWQNSAAVNITPIGRQMPALPWIALFAWYVIVMMQTDAGGVAAVITA
jgi:hypothetical protein